jgi:UDPglucose--hexose-1-phosphate uridylyltransferase
MHRTTHVKPDGRRLWCYSASPSAMGGKPVPSPDAEPVAVRAHLRWHPLIGEWVAYAAHRQDRTFLPPADLDPLAPMVDPARPTELPSGDYEVAVFENRFPSLSLAPGPIPDIAGVETAAAFGACEVVVYAQDAITSFGSLPVERVALILEVWADRTRAMAAAGVQYVLPFENRGVEMGVTLHHPHGQIYGYGFLPGVQARALDAMRKSEGRSRQNLVSALTERERIAATRVVADHGGALAFVPPFARFPYEVWIAPTEPRSHLADLTIQDRQAVAGALCEALLRVDALFGPPMPYLLTVNQAPTDGPEYPEWTLWIAIQPLRRAPGKLKFLAGTELGAGVFAGDVLPEAAAAALRNVRL